MDWLQFISSIISSLAWPGLVGLFLLMIRKQLGGLLARLIELHLPGGAKAVFAQELDKARDVIEKIETPKLTEKVLAPVEPKIESEQQPQDLINSAYINLASSLSEAREKLGLSAGLNLSAVVKVLMERGMLVPGTLDLFESLRRGRNAVVHAPSREITKAEAAEYLGQADFLSALVERALAKLTPQK
jgi:hypothetical protein